MPLWESSQPCFMNMTMRSLFCCGLPSHQTLQDGIAASCGIRLINTRGCFSQYQYGVPNKKRPVIVLDHHYKVKALRKILFFFFLLVPSKCYAHVGDCEYVQSIVMCVCVQSALQWVLWRSEWTYGRAVPQNQWVSQCILGLGRGGRWPLEQVGVRMRSKSDLTPLYPNSVRGFNVCPSVMSQGALCWLERDQTWRGHWQIQVDSPSPPRRGAVPGKVRLLFKVAWKMVKKIDQYILVRWSCVWSCATGKSSASVYRVCFTLALSPTLKCLWPPVQWPVAYARHLQSRHTVPVPLVILWFVKNGLFICSFSLPLPLRYKLLRYSKERQYLDGLNNLQYSPEISLSSLYKNVTVNLSPELAPIAEYWHPSLHPLHLAISTWRRPTQHCGEGRGLNIAHGHQRTLKPRDKRL